MIKKYKLFTALLLTNIVMFSQNSIEVNVLKLSGEIPKGKISLEKVKANKNVTTKRKIHKIKLYPGIEFQTIEGVGGAFNEIGGEALMSLPKAKQDEVMNNLFSLKKGAGFTLSRTAVGASDFGINAYSYSEKENDYKMKYFSIEREKKTVIPYIQKALEINPEMQLFASPWSPPAWMKYSGLMDKGDKFPEKNKLKDEPRIYKAYALYFSKYIKAYKKKGIRVDRLIIQNESDANTKYPSNDMSAAQMSKFAKEYLRPQFDKDRIVTEIWAGTFRTTSRLDAIEIVSNPDYISAFDGIGIQYTYPKYIEQMNTLYKQETIMHTEGKCYNGENSWEQASRRLGEVASYINRGVPNYCYWNMILNETTKSGWDWSQNSLINIDRNTKQVTYNPDYAVIAFISKYLVKGAKRIAKYSKNDKIITVKHKDEIHVLIQNDKNDPEVYEFQIKDGESQKVAIPSKSIAAITIKNK